MVKRSFSKPLLPQFLRFLHHYSIIHQRTSYYQIYQGLQFVPSFPKRVIKKSTSQSRSLTRSFPSRDNMAEEAIPLAVALPAVADSAEVTSTRPDGDASEVKETVTNGAASESTEPAKEAATEQAAPSSPALESMIVIHCFVLPFYLTLLTN